MQLQLIFLHGFLGNAEDWQSVIQAIQQRSPHLSCLALDLPGHGKASQEKVQNFAQMRMWLKEKLPKDRPLVLVGYSLGGRVTLDFVLQENLPNIKAVFLEGTHFGLATKEEKAERLKNDESWAKRLEQEKLETVLDDWYQQKVFRHLTASQRQVLIQKRSKNHPQHLAQILRALSLGGQENYLAPYWQPFFMPRKSEIFCIFGERDQKFKQIAERTLLPTFAIPHTGHNAHLENPQAFADILLTTLIKSGLLEAMD